MEYTDIRYSDITTCIDSVSARAAQLGDGWSPNELYEGEQSHAYIIKHPISTQLLLVMDTLHIRYSDITTCIDSVSARAGELGDGLVSQMNCVGESSLIAYNIKHPISTQLTPCDGIHWHQVQWHYYVYWFCQCQSSTNWGTDGSPNELCEGEQSHAYIIKHPIETQLTPCDGIHSHQVQWHYYVYWFCECQRSTTGGQMSPNELCGGEQSHAYIIKHPIETQLTPCDGIHWHQVQWHYYVYWFCGVPEQHNWGTDGLQMMCEGELSPVVLSGTHRINTRSNVTVSWCQCIHHKESIVWDGAWLCKHEDCSPSHNSFGDHSVPQLCCSGTHRINTRSNVTVPDVSVFHHKESIVFPIGAWLCKHETALPHTIHLETICPPVVLLWHSQNHTRSNVTVPDVSVFHHKESIVFQLGAWLCTWDCSPSHNSFGDHLSPSCAALALTESIHVVMSLYYVSVSITRSQLCWDWVLDYVSMRLLSPTQFIWRPSVPQFSSSGTHRINTCSNVTVPD